MLPDEPIDPIIKAVVYNKYCHPLAIWQSEEMVSGFEHDIPMMDSLVAMVQNCPEEMVELPDNAPEVCSRPRLYQAGDASPPALTSRVRVAFIRVYFTGN